MNHTAKRRIHPRAKSKSGPVKSMGKGRVCKKFRCTQRLSIYNLAEYCNVHLGLAE